LVNYFTADVEALLHVFFIQDFIVFSSVGVFVKLAYGIFTKRGLHLNWYDYFDLLTILAFILMTNFFEKNKNEPNELLKNLLTGENVEAENYVTQMIM
jgi:hypothetical protein